MLGPVLFEALKFITFKEDGVQDVLELKYYTSFCGSIYVSATFVDLKPEDDLVS